MQKLGKRVEFHTHTIFSDGELLPGGLVWEAARREHAAIALTDHADSSNLEHALASIVRYVREEGKFLPIKVIPGVEISYLAPPLIEKYAKKARSLGAKIIIVHGESPVEPVPKGTNRAALKLKGLVDILAHPGNLAEEEARLAAQNNIFLELSAKNGHNQGNAHVAGLAVKCGARLLVNSDAHSEKELITQVKALEIAQNAGLGREEALEVITKNPAALLRKIGYQ